LTEIAELVEREFSALELGMAVEEEVVWNETDVEEFRRTTGDDAPVHRDAEFAGQIGMPGPIVFGLLVVTPFSRLLGCRLPGTLSIIQSLRFDFVLPVLAAEPLRYRVEVTQLSPATRSVTLALTVSRPDGSVVVRGRAQCGLAR